MIDDAVPSQSYGKGMQAQCESNQQHKNKHRSCRQRTPADCSPKSQCDHPRLCIPFGFPLGRADCIDQVICDKTVSLQTMGDRLSYLLAQDSLLFLRHSFAIPKILYTLWTAPCFLSHELSIYDNILKSSTSRITNVPLGASDMAWTQASLPAKHRGLGILSAVQFAPSAFLASAAGFSGLVSQILPKRLQEVPYAPRTEALSSWMQEHDSPLPPDPAAHRQGLAKGLCNIPGPY